MNNKIVELLHLELEPVGIFFGNTSANCELEASPQKRNCVIPFVLAAAKGKITSMDEAGCTCSGGAVGACFGDGFTRLNPNIHIMLSQGFGEKAPVGASPMLKEGERFFCDAEVAMKWRNNMPFSDNLSFRKNQKGQKWKLHQKCSYDFMRQSRGSSAAAG